MGADEFLPVEEMERASCSPSCSGLFSQLKEVYLFGCNTLNPEALKDPSAEIEQSLLRSGFSRADAERLSRSLSARHGESSRDRMRLIFNRVPVIYGFSAKAPLGSAAASMLSGYFQSRGGAETGSGRASLGLLGHFRGSSMTLTSGLTDSDALAPFRRDVCQFSDDNLTPAQKIRFVHQLMGRDMVEVRLFLDRIEKLVASLSEAERQLPEVARAFDEIAKDEDARSRYLAFAREADQAALQVRMIKLARQFAWLTPETERYEFVRMIDQRLAKNAVGPAEVGLVCMLNDDGELDPWLDRLQPSAGQMETVARAAVLACLGSTEARSQVLLALTQDDDQEAQIAQVYLRWRPITDVSELREVTSRISHMDQSTAQVRALDTLASQHLSDPASLEELARMFVVTRSADVQAAIAGILIRSDYRAIAAPDLAALRESSLTPSGRSGPVDVLLRHLQGG